MQSEIIVEGYRVSVQQERLWRLCEEYGESHFRSACAIWLPAGALSTEVLERTLVELLRRHESLRTSFRRLAALAAPLQYVLDDDVLDEAAHRLLEFATASELLSGDDGDKARRFFDTWVVRDSEHSFDLSRAPLLRATVVEFEPQRHLLCLSASALVVDPRALAEAARQWVRAYAAAGGSGEQEEELVLQYADYAQWQYEIFESEETRDGRDFWQHALEGVSEPPPPGFLGGAQTPASTTATSTFSPASSPAWRPARVSFAPSAALHVELDHAARLCDSERRDLLEAAWRTLLWRLCDRPAELTLGVAFDGRGFAELRGAVGAFGRDLPVRIAMKAEQKWRSLVGEVRREREEAGPRQEFFEWGGMSSDETGERKSWWVGRHGFGFEFDESAELRSLVGSCGRREVFCLLLRTGLSTEGLCYDLEYDAGLISAQQARGVLEQYEAVLRGACARVEARLWELSAASLTELTETARRNRTGQQFDTYPALLHQLVEDQTRRTPERVAVECGSEVLSYAELDARAERLAVRLRQKGIGLEARVGLLMERSVEAVVSLLGVLKSGGCYVPLDPEYPHERLRVMLNDSGARVVLTQRRVLDEAGWLAECDVEVVAVDELLVELEKPDATGPSLHDAVSPQNLAYVIYTSGSTGTPKGVMVSHEAIRNRLLWMQQRFPLDHNDKVLLKTSLSFDASIWELFSPLLAGARVVLAEPGGQRDPDYLVREVQRRGITILQMVPSMWRELAAEGVGLESCKSLRRVYSGGEALGRELAERVQGALPAAELVNLYGPTEAAIDASYWLCGGGEVSDGDYSGGDYVGAQVVIGQPVANMALYVLDEGLKFCAAGEAGELYLSGVGLARGYLKRAALTADKFVPDPHAERPGARMYRTGDVARRLNDGRVAYVGRADGQVKVRGYRVELGEVEAALRALAGVREAVAVGIGTERLVAYVVADRNGTNGTHNLTAESDSLLETLPNGIRIYQSNRNETEALYQEIFEQQSGNGTELKGSALDVEELRTRLANQLPAYMVPSQIILLEDLPVLANGKVDRNALLAPDTASRVRSKPYLAPRTMVEEVIAGTWASLLATDQISRDDDFFELGGHSLRATQLVSRLRKSFGVEVPLRVIFETPKLSDIAAYVDSLVSSGESHDVSPIIAVARDRELPLSFAQQRLWFLDQLQPNSAFYNLPAAVRLTGKLDVAALEQSFNAIVRRHEALRTTFTSQDGRPSQVIAPSLHLTVPVEDLAAFPQDERETKAQRTATEEVQRPFDLTLGPLLRVKLLRMSEQEHILLLTMHHIVSDGWSGSILIRELVALYQAFANGQPSSLAGPAVQYADFAYWQRESLQGEKLDAQLEYWRRQLAGAPAALELPTDRPRPTVQTVRGAHQSFRVSAALTKSLKELSQREGATLFMTLLAAFKTLLYRFTGQEDIVVGTPIAGRNRVEIEGLVGFFVNTLVLRTDLSGQPTFQQLLARVRQTALGASAHQDLPFEKLVEELQPERDLSRTPLFQVMFVLQNKPEDVYELTDLKVQAEEVQTGTAKFDFELFFEEREDELAGTCEYNADLFDASTVERMTRNLDVLLRAMVEDPKQRITRIPILSEYERHELLEGWVDTFSEYPRASVVAELFEQQARRTPHETAVSCGPVSLTYFELNQGANQLAHRLITAGAGAESVVALLADRDCDFLTAILGVFKAGAAYLPLDPLHPAMRHRQVIEQSRANVLLHSRTFAEAVDQALAGVERRPLVRPLSSLDWENATDETEWRGDDPPPRCTPRNLAYVIYTSGSTGLPKGAMVEQRGMINHLWAKVRDLELNSDDVVAQTASQCFDISVWQFLAPLMVGGQVRIVPAEQAIDPVELLRELRDGGVTVLETVPSLLRVLLDETELKGDVEAEHDASRDVTWGRLRWLIATGEALPLELCRRWQDLADGRARLLNAYGPTECSDDVTHYELRELPSGGHSRVPIGRAIANTRLYVLDKQSMPVPVGVAGELYVGGDGVGRGYLGAGAVTADTFVPDPFAIDPGERLYRTGDICRYLPGGDIEFLGRVDQQVKVRGFRIELGEIEAVLSTHESVRECVVEARGYTDGEKRLVAYVTTNAAETTVNQSSMDQDGGPVTAQHLWEYMRERLPEYMAPSSIILLDQLPLTPNGKIDRKALPSPDHSKDLLENAYVAPSTDTERTLVEIWSRVLGVEKIGVADNFFMIGGHSLLATQVVSRVRQSFGIEMPLREMFESPTIAELSKAVEKIRGQQSLSGVSTITARKRGGRNVAQVLSQIQQLSEDEARQLLSARKSVV
jgi:amino acid adenylation domain-containing protein